jgi:predicted nuclease of predicted toxin-antitoxin system
VKFLVDNQLPLALARLLTAHGLDCQHVIELGMDEAGDVEIWNYAAGQGRTVISKDEDFLNLASQPGAQGQFIWVRIGNCRKVQLLAAFDKILPSLLQSLAAGNRIIEVR